jgi:putative glutamine amidotransferase
MAKTQAGPLPFVGLPADIAMHGLLPFHCVGDKYVRAIAEASEATPLVIPSLGPIIRLPELVERLDGIVITGSVSNVHPTRYGAAASPASEPYDPDRDATSLDLIRVALDQSVPLFAICRGIQELNVALGGTLQSELHDVAGKLDHREVDTDDLDIRYGPQHKITLAPGGVLAGIFETTEIEVNSLHRQAVARLAPPLQVEATAPDGTIEAVSVRNATDFALGVQWHPEYKVMENPQSQKLFTAFGDRARARAAARRNGEPAIAQAVAV